MISPRKPADDEPEPAEAPASGGIDRLARLVAHAINNPLAALVMDLDLLGELLDAGSEPDALARRRDEARKLVDEARKGADRIHAVVEELRRTATAADAVRALSNVPPPPIRAPKGPAVPAVVRVLVVDDDTLVANAVKRTLRQHQVLVLESSREALARFEGGERFDVVLCDLMMPEVTGMDLYEAVVRLDPAQARRIVFVTGGAVTTRARDFVTTTHNQVLEKPFDVRKLREVVARAVAGRADRLPRA